MTQDFSRYRPQTSGATCHIVLAGRRPAPVRVRGWTEPRSFRFPGPIGERTGYLVDVPDYDLFPALFQCGRVECRLGLELPFLNRMVAAMAAAIRSGAVRRWTPLAGLVQVLGQATAFLGHDWGGLGVQVSGRDESGRQVSRKATITAARHGHAIPVLAASVMADLILSRPDSLSGLVPVDPWLPPGALEPECRQRGYRLALRGAPGTTYLLLLATVAVAADLLGESILLFLPEIASSVGAKDEAELLFRALFRMSHILTGYVANGLYSICTLWLTWQGRRHLPGFVSACGAVSGVAGILLAVATLAQSVVGQVVSLAALGAALLLWLGGLGWSAAKSAGAT